MFSRRKLFHQSAVLYFPKLLSWLGGYLAFSLIFRIHGAGEYGDYILLTSYWGIPAIFAGDLIGSSSQKFLAQTSLGDRNNLASSVNAIWTLHFLALIGIGVVSLLAMPYVNSLIFKNPAIEEHWLLGLAIFFGTASLSFFRYVLRGLQKFQVTLAMDMTESIARNGLWIVSCFGVGISLGLSLSLGAAIALALAALVVYLNLFYQGFVPKLLKISPEVHGEIATQAKSFSVILFCNYILNATPAIVLSRWHGSEQVGLYAALFKIVDFTTGPVVAMAYILAPIATSAKLRGEKETNDFLQKAFKISILFLPLIALIAFGRSQISNIFGLSGYPEASSMMLAFCVFIFFANLSALFGSFADFLGYSKQRAAIMAVFAFIFVVTTVLLARAGAALEVAWGATLVYSFMVLAYLILIVRYHSWNFIKQHLMLLVKVVAALIVTTYLLNNFISIEHGTEVVENLKILFLRSLAFALISGTLIILTCVRRNGGRFILN